jgi:hypothetical protein
MSCGPVQLLVRRAKNEEADRLVNQALDARRNIEEKLVPRDHHPASHGTGKRDEARLGLFDKATPKKRIRLGILISGGGRTMLNIHDAIHGGAQRRFGWSSAHSRPWPGSAGRAMRVCP